MQGKKIRVLIADDSQSTSRIMSDLINSDPELTVAGYALNGEEAIRMAMEMRPGVIMMDIIMPVIDGFEATKQIMAYSPTPIIIVSGTVSADKVFKAISYGALDAVSKKSLHLSDEPQNKLEQKEFLDKIKLCSRIKVIYHPLAKLEKEYSTNSKIILPQPIKNTIIGIVSSTGGPLALQFILKSLPANFQSSILIVQHISTGFIEGLVSWLNQDCQIPVKIPSHMDEILPGTVYVAPSGSHMSVTEELRIRLSQEAPFKGFRPSGNVLLDSLAKVYQKKAVGIILTGMGSDGGIGLTKIKEKGGITIAQDEASSIIFGMPKNAIESGAAKHVLSLEQIPQEIMSLTQL